MNQLAEQLKRDYPNWRFRRAKKSHWDAATETIFYTANAAELLHELGHATLGHRVFTSDVDRLKKERAAWTQAKKLALQYQVEISTETIEDYLDTYRRWLHQRSLCPKCQYNGIELPGQARYRCLMCGHTWPKSEK